MTSVARDQREGKPSNAGRFLRIKDVVATTGLSRATIYRMVANRSFPAQVALTARSIGWWQADIDKWLFDRLGDRAPG